MCGKAAVMHQDADSNQSGGQAATRLNAKNLTTVRAYDDMETCRARHREPRAPCPCFLSRSRSLTRSGLEEAKEEQVRVRE